MAHYPDLEELKAIVALAAPSANIGYDFEVEDFSGLAGFDALGAPQAGAKGAVSVDLSVTSFSVVGVDENRRTFDELTELQTLTRTGLRHMTLTIRVTGDTVDAGAVAERVRHLLASPGAARLLKDLDLAVREISDARPFVASWGNGTLRAFVLEALLTFAFGAVDELGEAAELGNWIETMDDPTFTES